MRRGFGWEILLLGLALVLLWYGYGTSSGEPVGFELSSPEEGVVRVVSWNVGVSVADGGVPLSPEAETHVVSVLESLTPTMCLLQEVRDLDQLERLLDALGREWRGVLGASYGGHRVAVLAPTRALRTLRGSAGDGSSLGFQVSLPGDLRLTGVVVHADAFSSRLRNEQVGQAAELVDDVDGPVLLAGDLNIDLDLDKRRDLFSDDEYRDVETYNYLGERLVDATLGTGSTAEPDRRLDYVFVSGGWCEVVAAGPWRRQRAPGMDHDPVVVDLRPTAAAISR